MTKRKGRNKQYTSQIRGSRPGLHLALVLLYDYWAAGTSTPSPFMDSRERKKEAVIAH
jgi:hypothetical protein